MNTDRGTLIEQSFQGGMDCVLECGFFHCFIRSDPCNPRCQLHGWLGIDPSAFVIFALFVANSSIEIKLSENLPRE